MNKKHIIQTSGILLLIIMIISLSIYYTKYLPQVTEYKERFDIVSKYIIDNEYYFTIKGHESNNLLILKTNEDKYDSVRVNDTMGMNYNYIEYKDKANTFKIIYIY